MGESGGRRVVTGYATIWLDLAPGLEELRAGLAGKWRNTLKTAERAGLSVTVAGRRPRDYLWLLEQEDAQRAKRSYQGLPTDLVPRFAGSAEETGARAAVSLEARHDDRRVAGVLFLCHGMSATYVVGWNGAEGRRLGAHNLLMWRAVDVLKSRGVRSLDLGGVNTADGAGIARFKLGLGGELVTLVGTYFFS